MNESVIIAGARTPIGKLLGSLSPFSAPQLGGLAIAEAIRRAGVEADAVDAVIMGNVVQAGVGAGPARQAAYAGGIPLSTPALTVNKLCLSGLSAIALADQAIRSGQHDIVVAGGMESMSNAPHLVRGARRGITYGSREFEDALDRDALVGPIDGVSMGAGSERDQRALGISRQEQDRYAHESHRRAHAATTAGVLDDEIVPVRYADRTVRTDQGIRPDTTLGGLAGLRPAFARDGTITAGSASQLSDGAAAVLVMSKSAARERGLSWIAEVGAYGTVAGPDTSLHHQPSRAIRDALRRDGSLTVDDLDRIEINEAFAGVAIASIADLEASPEKVNVNGGAIALGHPVGMSGARLVLTLAYELGRLGGARVGAAGLCGGGGMGDALILRTGTTTR